MFIDHEERTQLLAKLNADAQRPPSSLTEDDFACDDGTELYSRDELIRLVLETVEGFLRLCDNEVDLATFAVDLLEYSNGPRPEIEILPQGDNHAWGTFKVTLDPEK